MTLPGGATIELHDQVIRQNCRTLKTPAIAAQYQGLADAAAREGHSHDVGTPMSNLRGATRDEASRCEHVALIDELVFPKIVPHPGSTVGERASAILLATSPV